MKYIKKKNQQITCEFAFSYKPYKEFIKEVIELAHKYESKSNPKRISYYATVNGVKRPYMYTSGLCSRCKDFLHIGQLDYDNCQREYIIQEISYLSKRKKLGIWYMFSTKEEEKPDGTLFGNYCLLNLEKKGLYEWLDIHRQTSSDIAQRLVAGKYSFKTIVTRFNIKNKNKGYPKFICTIGDTSKEYSYPASLGHLKVLKTLYQKIPDVNYTNLDKNEEVYYVAYGTASK